MDCFPFFYSDLRVLKYLSRMEECFRYAPNNSFVPNQFYIRSFSFKIFFRVYVLLLHRIEFSITSKLWLKSQIISPVEEWLINNTKKKLNSNFGAFVPLFVRRPMQKNYADGQLYYFLKEGHANAHSSGSVCILVPCQILLCKNRTLEFNKFGDFLFHVILWHIGIV